MDDYLLNYDNLDTTVIFAFEVGDGGIGDLIKYFIYLLQYCIQNNIKIKYLLTNNPINNYLKLKYQQFYVTPSDIYYNNITQLNDISSVKPRRTHLVKPYAMYSHHSRVYNTINIPGSSIFYFTEEITNKASNFIRSISPTNNYIGIHLRLGDKYIETDAKFKAVPHDVRVYNEQNIYKCIEDNKNTPMIFLCDNKQYALNIEYKYPHIAITNYDIGHTSYTNTTHEQIINTLSEFYLLAQSQHIYAASESGYSIMAAKFNNIPLTRLY
jgi:hypothetical protein